MEMVPWHDAYKCPYGCMITGIDIVTGKGKNAYWTTPKDLGNPGAGYSPNQSGILTSTGTSTGAGAGGFSSWMKYYQPINIPLVYGSASYTHYTTGVQATKIASYFTTSYDPTKPTLPVEKRDDPIHAWRYAGGIEIVNGVVLFEAVYRNSNGVYTADDRAVCSTNVTHHWTMIPVEICTCGFYASKPSAVLDRSCFDAGYDSDDDVPDVLLEVELYGKVIEATKGYRAQHQKILAVYSDIDYGVVPGFNIRPTSEAYDKMRKEVNMKIRFADGDKSFDIETESDMVMLYDGDEEQ